MRSLLPLLGVLLVTALPLAAGEKKPPAVTIRLHGEGSEREGESFVTSVELTNPQKKIFIRKVPILNERDFKAFYPFPGRDGMIGAYFVLDAHGSNKLLEFTTAAKGKIGVIMVNGRVSSAVRIESTVKDGIFFVPGGILPNEVLQLESKFPIVGREAEFGKKKPKAKAQ